MINSTNQSQEGITAIKLLQKKTQEVDMADQFAANLSSEGHTNQIVIFGLLLNTRMLTVFDIRSSLRERVN